MGKNKKKTRAKIVFISLFPCGYFCIKIPAPPGRLQVDEQLRKVRVWLQFNKKKFKSVGKDIKKILAIKYTAEKN